jgi:hypothetical protein
MTTGRINQVTILNLRRSEGFTSPGREADVSVTVKAGRRRIAPSRGRQTLQRSPDTARPIRLPPLSSPGDRPRREVSGTEAANLRRMYPPRGGSPRQIKPCYGPLSTRSYPRRLLTDSSQANNPQVPKWLPTAVRR